MKRLFTKGSLTLLAYLALFVGTTVISTTSVYYTHQPKCPEELLK
ncbi:cyclic lactone autoinducer peptide [Clostridiisalibacter paucivorans]|nr:cyclic lactone autoinducer peptide [Clostridiisalibacter paucivorans]